MTEYYTYRVRWSEPEQRFVATVAEFSSLSWLDASPQEALAGIMRLVEQTVEELLVSGAAVPEPFSKRVYSGNVRLRIPPEQHRDLAIRAAEEGVSLNRLLCSLISRPQVVTLEWSGKKDFES